MGLVFQPTIRCVVSVKVKQRNGHRLSLFQRHWGPEVGDFGLLEFEKINANNTLTENMLILDAFIKIRKII